MCKNEKENTNNLVLRIKSRSDSDKNIEKNLSSDNLILRIKKEQMRIKIKTSKDKFQFIIVSKKI